MAKRGRNWATRHTEEFKQFLREKCELNEETGEIKFKDVYASMYITIGWKSNSIAIPYSHLVWFLKHGRWPTDGMNLDHKDDNSWNNKPNNLQELTIADNAVKKRGRKVYSSYGKGKYGHGINVTFKKSDNRYQITRYFSRGETKTRKTIHKWLGSADTLENAELFVKQYIENGFKKPVYVRKLKIKYSDALDDIFGGSA